MNELELKIDLAIYQIVCHAITLEYEFRITNRLTLSTAR